MITLIIVNTLVFKPHGIVYFDNFGILTVYLPQFIVSGILSKRKGLSMIVAIIKGITINNVLVFENLVPLVIIKHPILIISKINEGNNSNISFILFTYQEVNISFLNYRKHTF